MPIEGDTFISVPAVPGNMSRRQMLRVMGAAGLTAASLSSLLAACTEDDAPPATGEDGATGTEGGTTDATVDGAFSNAFLALDPHTGLGVGTIMIMSYVFEGLYRINPISGQPVPALIDGALDMPDDATMVARLRQGATFHDGTPVTADDVVFSFERMLDPDVGSFLAQFVAFIDRITAIDETSVRFELNQLPAGGSIIPERLALVGIMSRADTTSRSDDERAVGPLGSGPYSVAEVLTNESVRLERFDAYNGPLPKPVQTINFNQMLDGAARVAAIRTGRLAAIEEVPYPDLASVESGEVVAEVLPAFTHSLLNFNCAKAPFSDKRVRQAIHYAIDREQLAEAVFRGHGRSAISFFPENHPFFVRPSTVFTRDVAKSQSLLEEAGVSDLEFELMISNVSWVLPQGELIESQLAEAGITVRLKPGETEALYDFVFDGSYDAYLAFGDASVFSPDPDLLLRWSYTGFVADGILYWTGEPADQLVGLLDAARDSSSEDERRRLYGEALSLIADEVPTYPLHHRDQATAFVEGTPGIAPIPRPGLNFLDGN